MNAITVIVTRAEPGAQKTAKNIEGSGIPVLLAPALSLRRTHSVDLPDIRKYSGLIFTSANGVTYFSAKSTERRPTAWCVGPATASAAKGVGFSDVQQSAGNAVDLAEFIAERHAPKTGPLLHIANSAAKGDLKSTLQSLGVAVDFCPLYEAVPAEQLPPPVETALATSEIKIVLFHSAKGADAFSKIVEASAFQNLIAVTISDPVAKTLSPYEFRDVFVAEAPNEDALMLSLMQAIATLSA